jgi:hypothetical protein
MEQAWNSTDSFKDKVLLAYEKGLELGLTRSETIERLLDLSEGKNIKPFLPFDDSQGCQTDDYGTVIDPITLDEIPEDKLISWIENNKKWCFNVEALGEHVRLNGPSNPMTRSRLPQEVISEIEEYFHVNMNVEIHVSGYGVDLDLMFPKTGTYAELFKTVFSYLYSDYGTDILESLRTRVLIPGGTSRPDFFNQTVTDAEVSVYDVENEFLESDYLFGYFLGLSEGLSRTSEILSEESYKESLYYVHKLSFVDVCRISCKVYGFAPSFYCRPLARNEETFSFFKNPASYFLSLEDSMSGPFSIVIQIEGVLNHWEEIKKAISGDDVYSVDLYELAETTILEGVTQTIKHDEYDNLMRCLKILRETFPSYSIERDYVNIIRKFTPQEALNLLSVFPSFRMDPVPNRFLKSGAYAKYLGVPVGATNPLFGKEIDENLVDETVAVTDDANLYEKYKPKGPYFLDLLVKFRSTKVVSLLPNEDKYGVILRMNDHKTISKVSFVPPRSVGPLWNYADVPDATPEGFNSLTQNLSEKQLTDFVVKLGRKGSRLFVVTLAGLAYYDWFPAFLCRVSSPDVSPGLLQLAYDEMFSTVDFVQTDVGEIYKCLDLPTSLRGYAKMKNKGGVAPPEVTLDDLLELNDVDLFAIVGEYGIVDSNLVYELYLATGEKNLVFALTKTKLKKLVTLEFLVKLFPSNDELVLPNSPLLEFVLSSKALQHSLSQLLLQLRRLPSKMNVLSPVGLESYLFNLKTQLKGKYGIN